MTWCDKCGKIVRMTPGGCPNPHFIPLSSNNGTDTSCLTCEGGFVTESWWNFCPSCGKRINK